MENLKSSIRRKLTIYKSLKCNRLKLKFNKKIWLIIKIQEVNWLELKLKETMTALYTFGELSKQICQDENYEERESVESFVRNSNLRPKHF